LDAPCAASSRRLRGVTRGQKTSLPVVAWHEIFPAKAIRLLETSKSAGDVNLSELAVLATAAAAAKAGEEIVEIGTVRRAHHAQSGDQRAGAITCFHTGFAAGRDAEICPGGG